MRGSGKGRDVLCADDCGEQGDEEQTGGEPGFDHDARAHCVTAMTALLAPTVSPLATHAWR